MYAYSIWTETLEDELFEFIESYGPKQLQDAAEQMDLSIFTQTIADYWQRRNTTSVISRTLVFSG